MKLTGPFIAHDPDYRAAKKDFETFVETLTTKISEKDATVPELPVKDLVRLATRKYYACPHVANPFCAGIPHPPRHPVQQEPTSVQGMFSPA